MIATLSTAFGALATVLAVIRALRGDGVHGDAALARDRHPLVWLVLREVLVAVGIAAGLPAAFALASLVRTQLYGIGPNGSKNK